MSVQPSNENNWTPESSLRKFYEQEFFPATRTGRPFRQRGIYASMLNNVETMLRRPALLSDLNNETLAAIIEAGEAAGWASSTAGARADNFRRLWRMAAMLGATGGDPPADAAGEFRGVRHGPIKWTAAEVHKLLSAAKRLRGTFKRRERDGTLTRIPRAVWFMAYVRLARATGLPWTRLARVRNGDITTAGMLVADVGNHGRAVRGPQAFRLSKAALRAIKSLRGESKERLLRIRASEETLLIWFRQLVESAGLAKLASGYRLTFGNGAAMKKARKPDLSKQVLPIGEFGLDSPLDVFLDRCYLPNNIRIRTDKTRSHYAVAIRNLSDAIGHRALVRDLTDESICLMLRTLEERELSPYTIQSRQNYVSALANWCSKRRLIGWWLNLALYPAPHKAPVAWKLEEVNKLFAACDKFPGEYFDLPAANWWRAFHFTLWDTGERTGAVLAIEPDWVNQETCVLALPASVRKGGMKIAVYELNRRTVDSLAPFITAARTSGRGMVFAFPGDRASFYNHYTRLLKLAGLPDGRKNKPQKMRRTFATFVEKAGGNATEALFHSDRRVTVKSYIDPTVVRRPAANLLLPKIEDRRETPPPPDAADEAKGGAA